MIRTMKFRAMDYRVMFSLGRTQLIRGVVHHDWVLIKGPLFDWYMGLATGAFVALNLACVLWMIG